MHCPHCGAQEKVRVKVCPQCGEAYASQDLLTLRQLEFLIEETKDWDISEGRRAPYIDALSALKARLLRQAPPAIEEEPVVTGETIPEPEAPREPIPVPTTPPGRRAEPVKAPELARAKPAREAIPFDRWLLSDRNIKVALYTGAILLVLAGLIFIGVNWTRIPGPGKFAITLLITGLMYLGGYHLLRRQAYRLGGIALLGVASGFLGLNFGVLQIYVLGPRGLSDDVMWLIASPLCLLVYGLTAKWTKGDLFTYLSLAALGSTLAAGLVVASAPEFAFLPAAALLACLIISFGWVLEGTPWAEFTLRPMQIVSHILMPLVIVFSMGGWLAESGCHSCDQGSPWLPLSALGFGVLFYVLNDVAFHWKPTRWVAALLFPLALSLVMIESDWEDSAIGLTLMILSLTYLGIGFLLERREGSKSGAWPLYITSYIVAIVVTVQAAPDKADAALILLGDVALLAISAAIHHDYRWVYAATWLLMLPVFLYISMFEERLVQQGLLMGVLGMNYTAVGFVLGRRKLNLGGPFLTAAAFLTILTGIMTWGDPLIASLVFSWIAVLYVLAAFWLGWTWLLLPALASINLILLAVHRQLLGGALALSDPVILSFAILGAVFLFAGLGLKRSIQRDWHWALYLFGALDLIGAYFASLIEGGYLAAGLSAWLAALFFAFTWFEQEIFKRHSLPPILSYLGAAVLFIGHFYLMAEVSGTAWEMWPFFTAALCTLFVFISWVWVQPPYRDLYGTPLRHTGLGLLIVPLLGSVAIFDPLLASLTFTIAGIVLAMDGILRKKLSLFYLSLAAFVVALWALLLHFEVEEAQAYVLPAGIMLLGIGWNERRRGRVTTYQIATAAGLLILMGSAFIQSLPRGEYPYAILLAAESLAAMGWGYRVRSRGYMRWGALALIADAFAQFIPAFAEFPRWVQLGLTGSLLLGAGLAALFKREQILTMRKQITEEWRCWEP